MEIAVIGAGLTGLVAARRLDARGHKVVVWEKSRGVGGRTATRRSPEGLQFDHGAPVLDDGGGPLAGIPGLAGHDLVLPDGPRHDAVGEGANNAPAKALAKGLHLRASSHVTTIAPHGERWRLRDPAGALLTTADAVVVTAPAPQAADLLEGPAPELAAAARTVAFTSCWTAMVAWDEPLELPFTATHASHGLEWAVSEAPKPGRAAGERWVLQGDAALSAEHLEAEPEEAVALLLDRFAWLVGEELPAPAHATAHRWRWSRPATPLDVPLLQAGTLVAAGDWCGGDDAGAAVRSGRAAAAALS
jgi:renalase